jgi:hypothetical protein
MAKPTAIVARRGEGASFCREIQRRQKAMGIKVSFPAVAIAPIGRLRMQETKH